MISASVVVVIDTVVLALLSLLVVGLLRSHAEMLRRLGGRNGPDDGSAAPDDSHRGAASNSEDGRRVQEGSSRTRAIDRLPPPRPVVTPAFDIAGRDLDGASIKLTVQTGTGALLAFLTSGCLACQAFWEGARWDAPQLPGRARLIVVTKDSTEESPARLRDLAPTGVPLVMSSAAWKDYHVELAPYFIYVDGPSGEVRSEGAASSWDQVVSLLRDALADEVLARTVRAAGAAGDPAPEHHAREQGR